MLPTHIPILQQAEATLPSFDNPRKRAYLTFRVCGFSLREAAKYAQVTEATVHSWRKQDEQFDAFERQDLIALRKQFGRQVIGLDFTRNLKLALELDAKILRKAHQQGYLNLKKAEQDYLNKIRPLYTIQALQALEDFFGDMGDKSWDELIVQAKNTITGEQLTVAARRGNGYANQAASITPQLEEGAADPYRDEGQDEEDESQGVLDNVQELQS